MYLPVVQTRREAIILAMALAAFLATTMAGLSVSWSADKNGVSPTTASLPTGPGSVEGLGGSFQVTLNTGSSAYGVSIAVPPGPGGHAPSISLSYASGLGDGVAGIGWSIGAGSVSRSVERGLPRYVDGPNGIDDDHDGTVDEADETDRFNGMAGEELARLSDGSFRARTEGGFVLYERVEDHWVAKVKNGAVLTFGSSPAYRIGDASGEKIFRWLLDKSEDVHGNTIYFRYASFEGSDNQKYLEEIRYGAGPGPWMAFYFLYFEYEDRPDWRKDYRSGFPIKTGKRLAKIRVGVSGAEPEGCVAGDWNSDGLADALIRSYELSYETGSPCSLLSRITLYGSDGQSYLPPASFSYSSFSPPESVSASEAVLLSENEPTLVMDHSRVELIDLNRDGLPDILKTEGGIHTGYLNKGECANTGAPRLQWTPGANMASLDGLAPLLDLSNSWVRLADMDGDGISDLVQSTVAGDVYYFENTGEVSWGGRENMIISDPSPAIPFYDPDAITMDVDFDKRMDILQSGPYGYSVWLNLGERRYSDRITSEGASFMGANLLFSDKRVRVADMNGDRLLDPLMITSNMVIYCANRGHGGFDAAVEIPIPEASLTAEPGGQVERARLMDINGDGLADLVVERAVFGELWYWLNLGTDAFGSKHTINNMPSTYGVNTVTRWADINANGTVDLVYADSGMDEKLRAVDIGKLAAGGGAPNLLETIDNGLGVQTRIEYRTTTEVFLEAERNGAPWATTLPFPMSVVSRVETTSGVDMDTEPGPDSRAQEYVYRNGYYDEYSKAFQGFEEVSVVEKGDASAPGFIVKHVFSTGAPDGIDNDGDGSIDEVSSDGMREEAPLRGASLGSEIGGEDGTLFSKTEDKFAIRTLLTNPEGIEIQLPVKVQTLSYVYEGEETPEVMKTEFLCDDFGNLVEQKDHGTLGTTGDEFVARTEYINDTDKWILGKPYRLRRTNGEGGLVSEELNYYDGAPFQGLSLGTLAKGVLSRSARMKASGEYANVSAFETDEYGNVVATKDGNGNLKTVQFDALFHTYPVREFLYPEPEGVPLVANAVYHLGYGAAYEAVDFNGEKSRMVYDCFGRVVKFFNPGDPPDYPSEIFAYTMVDPTRNVIYRYDENGKLTLEVGHATANEVRSQVREQVGAPGTFLTISFTDGLGRELGLIEKGEDGYILSGAAVFNKRGSTRYAFEPFRVASPSFARPDPSLHHSEHFYDALGRNVRAVNPPDQNGRVSETSAAYLPLEERHTDANGNARHLEYDGFKRLVEVREQNGAETYTTKYAYDAVGNLVRITDAHGNVTEMVYDGLGRMIEARDPDMGKRSYVFDDAGNLVRTTDNKGQTVVYAYDGTHRMLSEDYLDEAEISPDVTFHYDAPSFDYPNAGYLKGRLAWVEDLSGATFFSYDERGNPDWTVRRINNGNSASDYKTSMAYNSLGKMVSLTYPDGDGVAFEYNPRMLLKRIPGFVDTLSYDIFGKIASIKYANGVTTSYAYDPRQRLISLRTAAESAPGSPLQDLGYAMDDAGNITRIQDNRAIDANATESSTQSFSYDALHRLKEAQGAGYGTIRFGYDAIGNMVWKKSPEPPDPQHIDDPLVNLGAMASGGALGSVDRTGRNPGDPPGPHALTGTESGLGFVYDDNGNLARDGEGAVYEWDFKDRARRIRKGETEVEFVYNYNGTRTVKKSRTPTGDRTTCYVSNYFEVRDGENVKYVFAGNRRVARVHGRLSAPGESAEQVLRFTPGWNFFSLYVEPGNPSISSVLSPIEGSYTQVWAFDSQTGAYRGYVPADGIDDLRELHARSGYLIHVDRSVAFSVEGAMASGGAGLLAGWNLAGHGSVLPVPPEQVISPFAGDLRAVWSYDAAKGDWECYRQGAPDFLNTLGDLLPGKSYWFDMASAGAIDLPERILEVYFFHPDHLGSSSVLTDLQGEVVQRSEFYPFGRVRCEKEPGFAQYYGYTGQEEDAEVDLYNYNARLYAAQIARFISPDTITQDLTDPQTLNRYAYARNNPLAFVDPSGHIFNNIVGAVIGAFSAYVQSGGDWNAAAAGAVIGFVTSGMASSVSAAAGGGVFGGAVGGAAAGASSAALWSAYYGDAENAQTSILRGALNGGIFGMIGGHYKTKWSWDRVLVEGTAGGFTEAIRGGDFSHGFNQMATSAAAQKLYVDLGNLKYKNGEAKFEAKADINFNGPREQGKFPTPDTQCVGLHTTLKAMQEDYGKFLGFVGYHALAEGGLAMRAVSLLIPGANRFAAQHDAYLLANPEYENSLFTKTIGTWIISAPITYTAIGRDTRNFMYR